MPRHSGRSYTRWFLLAGTVALAVAVVVGVGVARTAGSHRVVRSHDPVRVDNRVVRISRPRALYWGASIDTRLGQAPWSAPAVASFERNAGKSMSIIGFSSPFYSDVFCDGFCQLQPGALNLVRAHGAIPM